MGFLVARSLNCFNLILVAAICAVTGCGARSSSPSSQAYVRGVQLYRAGNPDGAERLLLSAIERDPSLITPRAVLGEIYRDRRQYEKAATQYEQLIRLDPYGAEQHYWLGVCYHLMGRWQEAAAGYLRSLRLNPENARACISLGAVYLSLDQTDKAIESLRRATQLDPLSAEAHGNLAVALDLAGEFPLAERSYRASLEIDSTQPLVLRAFGYNLMRQGKPNQALAVLQQALANDDSAITRKRYADALAACGRYDEAREAYEALLQRHPRYSAAMNALADLLISRYRAGFELDESLRRDALGWWRKSLEISPNQPPLRTALEQWNLSATNIKGSR